MAQYKKDSPRISVKFINAQTEGVIFDVKDRTNLNMGELFSDYAISSIMENEFKGKKLPKKMIIMAACEVTLVDE